MESEHSFEQRDSDVESQLSRSTTKGDEPDRNMSLFNTQSSRWIRPVTTDRPDLEPGAEYVLTEVRTPFRNPNFHDPALWPDDLVDWDSPTDPKNPRNWPMKKKLIVTAQLGLTTMGASFASSSFSPAFRAIERHFHISSTVATLSLSLFVLGYAFGPLVWAPVSELYGRKISFLPAYLGFGIFLIGTATAQNTQTVMLCRFFAGFMASAPISNVAGCLADMYDDRTRGLAVVLYSVAVIGGPAVGPLIGACIVNSHLGWRWTEYITSFYIFFILVVDVVFLPETYGPTLLQRKASHLRYVTGNWALHSKLDEKELTFKNVVEKNMVRPLKMLFTEPIILLLAIYNAFVYGLLYLLFEAFPIAFEEVRHWKPIVSTLPFLGVLVGTMLSGLLQVGYQPIFWRKLDAALAAGKVNAPEARLPPMMLGGMLFASGLFVFGWTARPDIFWLVPVIGATMIGMGFILIFQNAVNYLIDAFTVHAASAQAANTFFRSLAGAGFPLFAAPMFHNLGVGWASSLLGFIAVALIPIPFLFYLFGERIRGRSRYSPQVEKEKL